jgi:hypothetical protein
MSRRSSARVRRARRLALRLAQAQHGFERHGNRCPAVVQQCPAARGCRVIRSIRYQMTPTDYKYDDNSLRTDRLPRLKHSYATRCSNVVCPVPGGQPDFGVPLGRFEGVLGQSAAHSCRTHADGCGRSLGASTGHGHGKVGKRIGLPPVRNRNWALIYRILAKLAVDEVASNQSNGRNEGDDDSRLAEDEARRGKGEHRCGKGERRRISRHRRHGATQDNGEWLEERRLGAGRFASTIARSRTSARWRAEGM